MPPSTRTPSPLLGFNNNVRHRGRLFHIQTEDSGIRHPHVITHLFADGGRILKTTKTSYAEHVGQPSFTETVRALMKEQHKAMFIALRDGQLDYLFDENAPQPGKSPPSKSEAPSAAAPAQPVPPQPEQVQPPPDDSKSTPKAISSPAVIQKPKLDPIKGSDIGGAGGQAVSAQPMKRTISRPRLEIDPAAIHGIATPPTSPVTASRPAPSDDDSSIDLDLDALERAASEAKPPFFQPIQDLPPPPASVMGRRTQSSDSGAYGSVPSSPEPVPTTSDSSAPKGGGRYAQSRPSSIFTTHRATEGASIFGDDLISEKSLDEVILSYLAEDLDGVGEKK